jgi:AcrR family transcriptional regulator
MTDTLADRTEVLTDRRPGRPRDTSLESTVLSATADLLLERDTKDVTIAAITERSGVSRAAVYRRWSSREELLAAALDSVRSSIELIPGPTTLETILNAYEQSSFAVEGRVGTLVKKRVAMGLENEGLRALSWDRHVSRRRTPIADEIRRGIAAGEVDASVDVEAMIDLINGLYYYQFVVRAPSDPEEARARIRAAVRLVFRGASPA